MATEQGLRLAKKLWGWEPHSEGQREFLLCDAKRKDAACGRRWGKSESTGVDIVLYALEHPNSIQFVIAPTDDQTKIIMEEVSRRLHSIPGFVMDEKRSPYHLIRFYDKSGLTPPTTMTARTAGPTGRGLRGNKAHRVVGDEAAFIPTTVMESVVGPMLADYDGDLVQLSTPCGRNHFWQSWQKGQDPGEARYRSFQFPSSANPYLPREFLAHEERSRPERIWRTEYLAEFLDDAGGVFRKVKEAATAVLRLSRDTPRTCVMGVDWGKTNDFTVLTVLDVNTREVVAMERFNQIDYLLQLGRLRVLQSVWNCVTIIAESNSIGTPLIEMMQREGLPVLAFLTTNATKMTAIEGLALAFERDNLKIPNDPVLIGELQAYAMERLPGGAMRYSAPEGMHDDCVMSLALAVWGADGQMEPVRKWF